jgi:polar amino acid transport system substrate-binding protein
MAARSNGLRRAVPVLVVTVVAVVATACGSGPVSEPPVAAVSDVLPAGAHIVHPTPPTPSAASCTDSIAPPSTMPAPGAMPAGSWMAHIQDRGHLVAGVDQNTFLWGYRDPVTGELSGFDIDMVRAVSEAIFGSPDKVTYVVVPNADRIRAVQDGEVDLVAETMTVNCDRARSVDFSSVYYEAGQRILVPLGSAITGPADLGGKRVCAADSSTSLQNLVGPSVAKGVQVWAVPNETDCLVMLQQGQVDAISTDDAILLGLAAQDQTTRIVGSTFSQEPYGMAISKAHPEFTSFVNGVLAAERADGAWARTYADVLGPYAGGATPAPPVATYRAGP